MPARHSRGYTTTRARLIASRYVRDPRPRIHVRVDPLVHRSLIALGLGLVLILLSFVLAENAQAAGL